MKKLSCLILFLLCEVALAQAPTTDPTKTSRPDPSKGGGLASFSGVMGAMSLGPAPFSVLSYNGSFVPADGPKSEVEQHRLNFITPISRGERDSYSASFTASSLTFGNSVVLTDTATRLPENFYRFEVGTQFSRQLPEDRNLGIRFSLGSASDKPFDDLREVTFSANATYSFPKSERSHWAWTVFVSNNNPLLNYIPIPGFIYFYRTQSFVGMFGLPFASIYWMPVNPLSVTFSIFGPTINSELTLGRRESLQAFAGFNYSQQSHLRQDRTENEDRVFLDEKKVFAGLRSPLTKWLVAEIQAGHAYDRSVYEGTGFGKKQRGNRDLDDSFFASWNLRSIF